MYKVLMQGRAEVFLFRIFVFRCVLVSLLGFSESLVKTYYWLASVLSASSQLLQKCEVFNTPSYILWEVYYLTTILVNPD